MEWNSEKELFYKIDLEWLLENFELSYVLPREGQTEHLSDSFILVLNEWMNEWMKHFI